MLFIPNTCHQYRLLSIDPGTTTLGVSILSIDLATGLKRVELAYTLNAAKSIYRYPNIEETQGERHAKLTSHYNAVLRIMREWNVHGVVSESPYLGKFAQAFEALVECLQMLEAAVTHYNPQMELRTIDPSTVKMNVGVNGKSNDKTLVGDAILKLPDLQFAPYVDLASLDEHSWDSIAVGYGQLKSMFVL